MFVPFRIGLAMNGKALFVHVTHPDNSAGAKRAVVLEAVLEVSPVADALAINGANGTNLGTVPPGWDSAPRSVPRPYP